MKCNTVNRSSKGDGLYKTTVLHWFDLCQVWIEDSIQYTSAKITLVCQKISYAAYLLFMSYEFMWLLYRKVNIIKCIIYINRVVK